MASSINDFYNQIHNNSTATSVDDLKKYRPASFGGVPFLWLSNTERGGFGFNEQSIATGSVDNNNQQPIQPPIETTLTNQEAEKIVGKGVVVGVDNYLKLKEKFATYNIKYISKNLNDKDILEGKAKLVLPLIEYSLVLVKDYNIDTSLESVGRYPFQVTFAAVYEKGNFDISNPKDLLESYSLFANDSIIENAINAIKDFNLSEWLNNGFDYARAFFAKYKDIQDIVAVANNIKNVGESLKALENCLFGDSNIVNEITTSITGLVTEPLTVAKDQEGLFKYVGNIFSNISLTNGANFLRKDVFKNIIRTEPEPITNNNYNAIKIINQNYIQSFIKSLAFISYANEIVNTEYKTSEEIQEEHKELLSIFQELNPLVNNDILTKVKNYAVSFLVNNDANNYNIKQISINTTSFPSFLYKTFKRISYEDTELICSLNPKVNILNWGGTVSVPIIEND